MKRIKLQVIDFQNINKHFVLYIYIDSTTTFEDYIAGPGISEPLPE